jgi:predicted nucleic acid-binding protein
MLRIEWVTAAHHASGVTALLIASNRKLSLVDCVSFETMRRLGFRIVFTFDQHFSEQGFTCIPFNEV